jgi:hypothetical protein
MQEGFEKQFALYQAPNTAKRQLQEKQWSFLELQNETYMTVVIPF